ncbi:MAG: 4-demethylwyosine synthase TYW1 [Euryarchaeota archaeon]|nr:4-demethylwyosine synthase TYW1 [Euryarchaeota archaeon]
MVISNKDSEKLEKAGYRFVGDRRHAAAKVCHWTKKSLLDQGVCYKQKFYGIESHRCLQMSPSIPYCHQKCLFCWRDVSFTKTKFMEDFDEPSNIIDGCVDAQRNLLCGFFGNENANQEKLQEAQDPIHAAISLAGEPMLYPMLDELVQEFHRKHFTTFLVTNGMTPARLENLAEEPTQLYISLDAPNKEIHQQLCRPQVDNVWMNLNKSLDLLSAFNCRTVIRMTCVKGYNMQNPTEYADLIKKSSPDFVEVKAYMYVGDSRRRLKLDNMPSFQEIYDFASSIAENCGLEIVNESYESRVVLLR